MSFGTKLKYVRNFRHETQQSLGEKMGFPKNQADSRIAQYESGLKKPRFDMLQDLSAALDVTSEYLYEHCEDIAGGFMRCIFEFERLYGAQVEVDEDSFTVRFNKKDLEPLGIDLWMMQMILLKKAVEEGQISQHDYEEWKLQWPDFHKFEVTLDILDEKLKNTDTTIDVGKDLEYIERKPREWQK